MIKKFTREISSSQSQFKARIERKYVTQQCSYNLPIELENHLKSLGALVKANPNASETHTKYFLADEYSLLLGVNIIAAIGESYQKINNRVIFTHTEGSNGSSQKMQLKKTDFQKLGKSEYNWFVDLYEKNIESTLLVVWVDDEKKSVTIDLELTPYFFSGKSLSSEEIALVDIGCDVLDHNLYGIHIKQQNRAISDENPYICIGWSDIGNLSAVSTKDELGIKYDAAWPSSNPKAKAQNIGQIWRFIKEMQVGDYVVFADGDVCHIGRITSDYYFDDRTYEDRSADYVNIRNVKWLKKEILRSDLSEAFHRSLMTAMSIWTLNDYKSAVYDLLKDTYEKDVSEQGESAQIADIFDYSATREQSVNKIFYGVPGCGKSHHIEYNILGRINGTNDYQDPYSKDRIIRTTFYQDYSNTDFVGQILPKIVKGENGEKDTVEYIFNPGPFTLALIQAISNPDKKVALVIEEINRGNAPAIFGDIFQLLDRDDNSISEYGIVNVGMIDYLNAYEFDVDGEKKRYIFKDIKIPGNMDIFATMNTSDQNVYTLDTAFTRRWAKERIPNSFNGNDIATYFVPGMELYTWGMFVDAINTQIQNKLDDLQVNEDKQVGAFFVKKSDLLAVDNTLNDEDKKKKARSFAHKVLEYLWDDVSKLDHSVIFNSTYKTFEKVVEDYLEKGVAVFNSEIFKNEPIQETVKNTN